MYLARQIPVPWLLEVAAGVVTDSQRLSRGERPLLGVINIACSASNEAREGGYARRVLDVACSTKTDVKSSVTSWKE